MFSHSFGELAEQDSQCPHFADEETEAQAVKERTELGTCPLPHFTWRNKVMGDSIAMSSLLKEARKTPQIGLGLSSTSIWCPLNGYPRSSVDIAWVSVLDLFFIHMLSLGDLTQSHGFNHHLHSNNAYILITRLTPALNSGIVCLTAHSTSLRGY